jgi:predicted DNA-binding protein
MISDKNTRTLVTLSRETKKRLEQLAKSENRSLNNYIITVLMKHLEGK